MRFAGFQQSKVNREREREREEKERERDHLLTMVNLLTEEEERRRVVLTGEVVQERQIERKIERKARHPSRKSVLKLHLESNPGLQSS